MELTGIATPTGTEGAAGACAPGEPEDDLARHSVKRAFAAWAFSPLLDDGQSDELLHAPHRKSKRQQEHKRTFRR